MYLTEKEIFDQYNALAKTLEYFQDQKKNIRNLIDEFETMTFIGSGSSYSISRSGEISTKLNTQRTANSIVAGDLMMNFPLYDNLLKKTLLIAPSRSGSTSEVLESIKKFKEKYEGPSVSISARKDSKISHLVDLSLEIPWAYDESVCQTRTVTNLYAANLLLISVLFNNKGTIDEIKEAVAAGEEYIQENKKKLKKFEERHTWNKVVVLADSELEGIGDEAGLAFKEIARTAANYYHILDVRHGPMVLVDDETLVIIATTPYGLTYQEKLIDDLKVKGAKIITVGAKEEEFNKTDLHIEIPDFQNYGVRGIPFIFVPQVLAYYQALSRGFNPDKPEGLNSWIELSSD